MPKTAAPFSPAILLDLLGALPPAETYLVGFSGGADSTALLHALYESGKNLSASLEAVHFNHGLHPDADGWENHCRQFCTQRNIPLSCHSLDLSPDQPNLEHSARVLRYAWAEEHLGKASAYLTAHHADDRAETFLLNAFRGSGLDGLASIPEARKLGKGMVLRPLLNLPRVSLVEYLKEHGISWIDDPSNDENGPDRNFIRNEILPLIETRWPAARRTISRTSDHLQSANRLLKQLMDDSGLFSSLDHRRLAADALGNKDTRDASQFLRHWLDLHEAPPPPEKRLSEFLDQLRVYSNDSHCELSWVGWRLRLFRGDLYLSEPGELPDCPEVQWSNDSVIDLGPELGAVSISGEIQAPGVDWNIGMRHSEARIRIWENGHSRKLKKVMQEWPIPHWQRDSMPVLYRGRDVLAIGDWLLAEEFELWLNRHHFEYRWEPGCIELADTHKRCHQYRLLEGHKRL